MEEDGRETLPANIGTGINIKGALLNSHIKTTSGKKQFTYFIGKSRRKEKKVREGETIIKIIVNGEHSKDMIGVGVRE